jgi:hypothetical protein
MDRAIRLASGRNRLAGLRRLERRLRSGQGTSRRQQLRLGQPRKIEDLRAAGDLERPVLSPGLVRVHLRLEQRRRAHPARAHHVLQ